MVNAKKISGKMKSSSRTKKVIAELSSVRDNELQLYHVITDLTTPCAYEIVDDNTLYE